MNRHIYQLAYLFIFCFYIALAGCKQGSLKASSNTPSDVPPTEENPPPQDQSLGKNTDDKASVIKEHSFTANPTESYEFQKTDILFVNDNSASMWPYQEELGRRFGNLNSGLENVDWQMAFINTDSFEAVKKSVCESEEEARRQSCDTLDKTLFDGFDGTFYNLEVQQGSRFEEFISDGKRIQILSPEIPNADESLLNNLFLNTITRKIDDDQSKDWGSGIEMPFTQIINAVSEPKNQDFFREDASLAVVILTNEGPEDKPANHLLSAIEKQFEKKRVFGYGIIPTETTMIQIAKQVGSQIVLETVEDKCYGDKNYDPVQIKTNDDGSKTYIQNWEECSENYLPNIKDFVKKTGGILGDIDVDSYASILKDMAGHLKANLTPEKIELEHKAKDVIADSITLEFHPAENNVDDWFYNARTNAIVFYTLPPETSVTVNYKYKEKASSHIRP